ncbi:MAG TPA: TorF family putative porin [Hyphomicrobium sp.]|nr:TorF family putative porin [Hyphomicrobium sp.]
MTVSRKLASLGGALGVLLIGTAGAIADGYEVAAPVVVDEGRKFTYSFNIGAASQYVFRGVSQSDNDPAIQGGVDVSWGILYAGIWASSVDFSDAPPANAEVDWYGGIKPTWESPLGKVNLDFGVIYYSYPGANPSVVPGLGDPNFVELKAGYSWSALHPSLVTGTTVYWSPDYVFETGSVWTIETLAAWTLPKVSIFTPVVNGVLGWQKGDAKNGYFVNVNGTDDEYYYWNAGLNIAVENISFDFRYWDTNINSDAGGLICGRDNLCDERFVFSAKVVVP